MAVESARVSIIVPALNEAENIPLLVPRVDAAMDGRPYEVIIVDDNSRDATPVVIKELSKTYPVSLLVRPQPKDGLSGAVLEGMAKARGDILVVMDADLQHPPEKLPDLLAPLDRNEADFVVGSRYVKGGSTEGEWGFFRKINSSVATVLARPFAGRTTDPMSGFFALRRESYCAATRLTPLGYKIGLELMCKCRVQRVKEIPIHFGLRQKGESKLTIKQQFKYLEHLSRLYDYTFPRGSPILKFAIATSTGWLVGFAAYLLFVQSRVLPTSTLEPIFAYPFTILTIAVFHLRYVRTQREFILRPHPWRDFWMISLMEWATCAVASLWVTGRVNHLGVLELFLLTFGAATVVRYILRKEFLHDIRGLRREFRYEDWT
ncbi:MAG TPA: polyprenol monophosphomannose synthase [Tepidisphaeraceae bacterium]|jgi:glycosyltransferase involved in cell wall biosynthesis